MGVKKKEHHPSRPVSPGLSIDEDTHSKVSEAVGKSSYINRRVFFLSLQAVFNAIIVGFIAKVLMLFIHLFTNIAFYGKLSFADASPSISHWGLFVILVPIIGGVIVGLIARYGSAGIRGHGIPEAMEKVLTNQSKVSPIITILKPLASAIAIGTGGPFGAEGPAIATGGAFGSLTGQVMKINATERKIILACGACAGMAAIFGSPIASIMLGIELLLFEFSPRSIIPLTLSCAAAAAMHYLLFSTSPIFEMASLPIPNSKEIIVYTLIGVPLGLAATFATKGVYFFEDLYKKLPIHWMWWPAIGGIAIGVIGYFAPKTLGVGYSNIDLLLTGKASLILLFSFSVLKYFSWSVSLGSGTAGGTLAPLFTMGGGLGALLGIFTLYLFPHIGINVATAGLIGMAALFAGSSGAILTSIIFVLETTGQFHDLLPVVGAASVAYFISYFILKGSSIMTLEIERRGIPVPGTFEANTLGEIFVKETMNTHLHLIPSEKSIKACKALIADNIEASQSLILIDKNQVFQGSLSNTVLHNTNEPATASVGSLLPDYKSTTFAYPDNTLQTALEIMSKNDLEEIPILSREDNKKIVGTLNYKNIFSAYNKKRTEDRKYMQSISLKRQGLGLFFKK